MIPHSLFRDDSAFYTFVNGITADGGGDSPEDIMGGLKVALNSLSWRSDCSRVGVICIVFNPLPNYKVSFKSFTGKQICQLSYI